MILRLAICMLVMIGPAAVGSLCAGTSAAQQWMDPFPPPSGAEAVSTDSITLHDALQKVAHSNPSRQAFRHRLEAVISRIEQAGLRPNPEIEFQAEDFGGDLPGSSQAEFTAGLSQEIELWGKRTKRRRAAKSETDAARLDLSFADYDLYGETCRRYYLLVHAQNNLALAEDATKLAETMTASVQARLEHGAAMISELLLSELELQRARLEQARREYERASAQDDLAALWDGKEVDLVAVETGLEPGLLKRVDSLIPDFSNSKEVLLATTQESLLRAQLIYSLLKTNRISPLPGASNGPRPTAPTASFSAWPCRFRFLIAGRVVPKRYAPKEWLPDGPGNKLKFRPGWSIDA